MFWDFWIFGPSFQSWKKGGGNEGIEQTIVLYQLPVLNGFFLYLELQISSFPSTYHTYHIIYHSETYTPQKSNMSILKMAIFYRSQLFPRPIIFGIRDTFRGSISLTKHISTIPIPSCHLGGGIHFGTLLGSLLPGGRWLEPGMSWNTTVDGSEIRRFHQLRLVVYPIIYDGFYASRWLFEISSINSMKDGLYTP